MIRVKEAIVVEGKYDKIKLTTKSSFLLWWRVLS